MKIFFKSVQILVMLLSLILAFTACKKNEESNLYLHNKQDAIQTAFADETKTNGFTFTAKNNWVATIKEITNHKNNDVSWLTLFCSEMETYIGNAGTFSMDISLELNYSGQTRRATIEIMSGDDKITITVTQSGTTEEGEVPEPEPVIIDLSNAIWGEENIVTLKIFSNGEHLLVSTNVAETGYKITLPNPEAIPVPLASLSFSNMSDPNTKGADIGQGPIPYNSNGWHIGQFELRSENDWFATYIYDDRDCHISGTNDCNGGACITIHADCYFKKGWNIYYINGTYIEDVWINIWTTEKPSGESFKWSLWRWGK